MPLGNYGYNPAQYKQDFSWLGNIGQAVAATADKMPDLLQLNQHIHENQNFKQIAYQGMNDGIDKMSQTDPAMLNAIATHMGYNGNVDKESMADYIKSQIPKIAGESQDSKEYGFAVAQKVGIPMVDAINTLYHDDPDQISTAFAKVRSYMSSDVAPIVDQSEISKQIKARQVDTQQNQEKNQLTKESAGLLAAAMEDYKQDENNPYAAADAETSLWKRISGLGKNNQDISKQADFIMSQFRLAVTKIDEARKEKTQIKQGRAERLAKENESHGEQTQAELNKYSNQVKDLNTQLLSAQKQTKPDHNLIRTLQHKVDASTRQLQKMQDFTDQVNNQGGLTKQDDEKNKAQLKNIGIKAEHIAAISMAKEWVDKANKDHEGDTAALTGELNRMQTGKQGNVGYAFTLNPQGTKIVLADKYANDPDYQEAFETGSTNQTLPSSGNSSPSFSSSVINPTQSDPAQLESELKNLWKTDADYDAAYKQVSDHIRSTDKAAVLAALKQATKQ